MKKLLADLIALDGCVADFVHVWDDVTMLARYDVKGHRRYIAMAA